MTPGPKGDTGLTGPAGLSYVSFLGSNVTTLRRHGDSRPAPVGYTLSVAMTAGRRYLVTGDVTFWNAVATQGLVSCRVYGNGSSQGAQRISSIPASGYSMVSFSTSFLATSTATQQVYLGCVRGLRHHLLRLREPDRLPGRLTPAPTTRWSARGGRSSAGTPPLDRQGGVAGSGGVANSNDAPAGERSHRYPDGAEPGSVARPVQTARTP